MKTLKKNNISQGSSINSPVPVNKNCDLPPFFNEDYFGHVVVQTIAELNDIPCKLRQDGMVATVVQDSYAEWQLQSSRTGFGICDNNAWVKINSGDTFYDGSNLFIFPTQAEADIYKSTPTVKEGQVIYITETNTYFKYDGRDAYVDPFPNKLTVPTEDGVEGPDYKVPAYLADGAPYWRSTKDFGKVKSVNGKIGEVVLKTSDLENDSDYTTNSKLNKEVQDRITQINNIEQKIQTEKTERISEDNILDGKITTERTERIGADELKLDKPTTVGTTTSHPHVVGVDSNGNSAKLTVTDFGKVDGIRVNGIKQPLATDRYVDLNQEFVKNGLGWSLKHQVDNPTFYGALGKFAVNLSNADKINTDVSKPYGAVGEYTFSVGYLNHANGNGTFVAGALNTASGQCNHVISFRSTIKEDKGLYNRAKPNNGIFSGEFNTIDSALRSIIIGGQLNTITGKYSNIDSNQANYTYENSIIGGNSNLIYEGSRNVIIGGFLNIVKKGDNTNRDSYGSIILGGEENRTQGHYNVVGGFKNHAVTVGETIFGLYSTIQNQNLSGFDYIDESRVFNVGVGKLIGTTNFQRRDGLSVFRNGLVTTPTASNSLIDSDLKAVVTKEYLDTRVDKVKTVNKIGPDEHGNIGLDNLIDPEDLTRLVFYMFSKPPYQYTLDKDALTNMLSKGVEEKGVLEFIDGTYVKKTIENNTVVYEPLKPIVTFVENANANQIGLLKKRSAPNTGYEFNIGGILCKMRFDDRNTNNIEYKLFKTQKGAILDNTEFCDRVIVIEEQLTGKEHYISFTPQYRTPRHPGFLFFMGKILVGYFDNCDITVENSKGDILRSLNPAYEDRPIGFKVLDFSSHVVAGETYTVRCFQNEFEVTSKITYNP